MACERELRLFHAEPDDEGNDLPVYIVAKDWAEAIEKWRMKHRPLSALQAPGPALIIRDPVLRHPKSVRLVADTEDLIV